MEITHVIYFKDNWDGESEKYWMFACLHDEVFFDDQGSHIIQTEGDEILKAFELDMYSRTEQLQKENTELKEALWHAMQCWEFDGVSPEHGAVAIHCDSLLSDFKK